MIFHSKSLVLVRKGRAYYATLYQDVFFGKKREGGVLNATTRIIFYARLQNTNTGHYDAL